jgi:hypothetical protein
MSRIAERLVQSAIGLVVVFVLAFGATELRAASGSDCVVNPPMGQLGHCDDQAQCEDMCEVWGGADGLCDPQQCCTCMLR